MAEVPCETNITGAIRHFLPVQVAQYSVVYLTVGRLTCTSLYRFVYIKFYLQSVKQDGPKNMSTFLLLRLDP